MMGSSLPLFLFFLVTSLPLFLLSHAFPTNLHELPMLSFEEGYKQLFGDSNLMLLRDGKTVHIALDERTGAGFASQEHYLHGFFSAAIKLPSDYTAGVVVAFYMSNGDVFEKNHDELDFEFLGNIRDREWRVQTNVYGNGSTSVGREERYELWFDPTEEFHRYSILWSHDQIIFYVDKIPIREVVRSKAMGGAFPSKPMSLYATIWDGSGWATAGGRYKVNYKFAPYIAQFSDIVIHGCATEPTGHSSTCNQAGGINHYTSATMPSDHRLAMQNFRRKYMTYSYCYDRDRYPDSLPECSLDPREDEHLHGRRSRHGKSRSRRSSAD